MKILNRRAGILAASALVLVIAMSGGCGSDKSTAPDKSSITINPATVTTTGPGTCSSVWKEQLYTVTVYDSQGNPINNAAIIVTLDWAPNYAQSNAWSAQLYDGTTPVDVPYQTTTGDFGTKELYVRYDYTCPFKGELEVFSGSAYNKADITVQSSS